MRIGKILGVWAVLAGLMVCNGALRIAVLQPLLGTEAGEMFSGFLGIIIVFGVSRFFLANELELPARRIALVSATWVVLTIAFETTLGLASGESWREIGRTYALWDGSFWPVIVVAVGSAPFVWLKRWAVAIPRIVK